MEVREGKCQVLAESSHVGIPLFCILRPSQPSFLLVLCFPKTLLKPLMMWIGKNSSNLHAIVHFLSTSSHSTYSVKFPHICLLSDAFLLWEVASKVQDYHNNSMFLQYGCLHSKSVPARERQAIKQGVSSSRCSRWTLKQWFVIKYNNLSVLYKIYSRACESSEGQSAN